MPKPKTKNKVKAYAVVSRQDHIPKSFFHEYQDGIHVELVSVFWDKKSAEIERDKSKTSKVIPVLITLNKK